MSASESEVELQPGEKWIPEHCMRKAGLVLQDPDCPIGYMKRRGHIRRMPSVESTHKFMNKFQKELRRYVVRNPVPCPPFDTLEEFTDCMKMVRRSLQSYLLNEPPPTRTQIKRYINHLVERVFDCTGKKLQNTCYFQPTTVARRYIERQAEQYV